MTQVTLAKAKKLYQKVKGTSSNSEYSVFAIGPKCKMAARWANNVISVRLEPVAETSMDEIKAAIKEDFEELTGAKFHDKKYASCHIAAKSKEEAAYVLGAVSCLIVAKGFPIETPVPDINKVVE